jgi:hypothetical protein
VRGMYCVGRLFDKSAHLFIDLPAMKAILGSMQVDHSFTPQISFADSSNYESAMLGCIRPGSIQSPV